MKQTDLNMRKYLYTLLAICALASCKKDETLRYNNMTMGNIQGESIISDQGNTFNIAETYYDVDLKLFESGRVMVLCDVLKKTSDNTYDIRLSSIVGVLAKEVKTMDESTSEENLEIDDPLIIREIWYSGGYLNMGIEFARKAGSESIHYINLIQKGTEQEEGQYTFILRHNALGEVPSADDREYSSSTGYVSFPIAGIIKEDSAKISLEWNSFKIKNGWYNFFECESVSKGFNWSRNGYEHAPAGNMLKSIPVLK